MIARYVIAMWIAFRLLVGASLPEQWVAFAILLVSIPVLLYHAVEAPFISAGRRLAAQFNSPVIAVRKLAAARVP